MLRLGKNNYTAVDDLVSFQFEDDYLIVNPRRAAFRRLSQPEFAVIKECIVSPEQITGVFVAEDAHTAAILAQLVLAGVLEPSTSVDPAKDTHESPLRMLYFACTDGCNLRCPYCYVSSTKKLNGELETAEAKALIDDARDLGAQVVAFTGGEPLLRRDLFELAAYASGLGLRCNIITNATLISGPRKAHQVAEAFDVVTISLDGGIAERHDETRGQGTFERTRRALGLLNAQGIKPLINHVVTNENIEHLGEMAALVSTIEVRKIRLMNHTDLGRVATEDRVAVDARSFLGKVAGY